MVEQWSGITFKILVIITTNKQIKIMKNAVQIKIGFFCDWQPFTNNDGLVFDFEQAIRIVRRSGIRNVQLQQESNGNVMEWDNF